MTREADTKRRGATLAGLGVVVTRPAAQAEPLCARIEARGGKAIRFPTLAIEPPEDPQSATAAVEQLGRYDMAVFVSPNAVSYATALVRERGVPWPRGMRVAAVGRTTAEALRAAGHPPDAVPAGRYDSESLLECNELRTVAGKHVVIFQGSGGRELLAQILRARGAHVTIAEVYRRVRPRVDPDALLARWRSGEVDIATATSNEALRNLYDMLGNAGRGLLLATPLAVFSERCAALARELGFQHTPIVAEVASDEALVQALEHWQRHRGGGGESNRDST
ncbi:MAG: uroporphyrinogen-III synthase [Gammaproteobacteria bacterium]|nr:uroporphyrinogen-III synthase [Gammaproteobacteria bacterium]NIT63851.1 uroporphyrinogen-III synthase [Gammaproteobacteria bacterium]NIV20855.1 uroporphyrinogen-III synthase [Gammaproteobacteria bacterium]NIY32431.1 uroporphyrinogen-III synthase [Gammaproteobacteria bacterium]